MKSHIGQIDRGFRVGRGVFRYDIYECAECGSLSTNSEPCRLCQYIYEVERRFAKGGTDAA